MALEKKLTAKDLVGFVPVFADMRVKAMYDAFPKNKPQGKLDKLAEFGIQIRENLKEFLR